MQLILELTGIISAVDHGSHGETERNPEFASGRPSSS